MTDKEAKGWTVVAIIVALLLFVGGAFIIGSMRAASFNRITGSNVTWYDALTTDLRVMREPKP